MRSQARILVDPKFFQMRNPISLINFKASCKKAWMKKELTEKEKKIFHASDLYCFNLKFHIFF